jgi:rhamnosyltransferase
LATTLRNDKSGRPISVAILGSRGIPAGYGGYETIAQELSVGLAKRGFEVYVSCESKQFLPPSPKDYNGVKLVYFPIIRAIRNISEVIEYDLMSVAWSSLKTDMIYMLGYSSVLDLVIPKLLGKIVIVNVDGLESERRHFNSFLRFFYRSFERIATKLCDYVIVDSKTIGVYYDYNYGISSVYIPNGGGRVLEVEPFGSEALKKYGLGKGDYYLVIARLVVDNNISLIIDGFKRSNSKKKLVIVGPLTKNKYVQKLVLEKNDNVLFIGGVYETMLQRTLRYNCYAYIHGHERGGTNPSLLEALLCSNVVLYIEVPFTREVAENLQSISKKTLTT